MSSAPVEASPAPAPSLAPPPGHVRIPLTDSLRGLAALMILAGHTMYLSAQHDWWIGRLISNFNLAVDLFFVLSGLLLYRPFVAARARGRPPVSLRKFARRRTLRILPTYWAALTLVAIWPGLPDMFTGDSWKYYALVHVYDWDTLVGGLGVTWTLCIEATFYLMLPAFAVLMARWTPGRLVVRREMLALGVLAVIPGIAQVLTLKGVLPLWAGYNTLLGYSQYFALGMALAVLSVATAGGNENRYRVTRFFSRHPALCWLGAGVANLLVAWKFYVPHDPDNKITEYMHIEGNPLVMYLQNGGRFWLFGIACTLLVAPAVFGRDNGGLVRRFLTWKPLVAIGVISYSLSLWHGPVLSQVAPWLGRHELWLFGNWSLTITLVTFALSLPIAYASYRLFELPFLKRKEAPVRPAAAQPVVPDPARAGAPAGGG